MKAGTWVAFGAGVLICLIVTRDGYDEAFSGLAAIASRASTFVTGVLELPPFAVALLGLGVGLRVGRNAAERGRARKDADDTWNKRKAYRRG